MAVCGSTPYQMQIFAADMSLYNCCRKVKPVALSRQPVISPENFPWQEQRMEKFWGCDVFPGKMLLSFLRLWKDSSIEL